MNKLLSLLLIAVCWSCTQSSDTEKYQSKRDNVIKVKDKVKEIKAEDVLIGNISRLYLISNYLIIADHKSPGKLIHLFDKNNFSYLTSTTYQGQGPDEITMMGHIGIDEANRRFYVSDHGKLCIFSYDLDSVLTNLSYTPIVKTKLNERLFPGEYQYINDTLCIGRVIEPIGNADFKPFVAKWNSEITLISHFGYSIAVCDNKIIALYSGEDHRTSFPTKFLVFDINGNYLQTLDTEYKISDFCYDKENNRIIMVMNDDIQFAYLDLDEIAD